MGKNTKGDFEAVKISVEAVDDALARLMKALDLVEDDKKAQAPEEPAEPAEYVLSVEHLDDYGVAVVDRVSITNLRRIILAKNVFEVSFLEKFNSTKAKVGDVVPFYFKKDVRTIEGTLVIPANTKLYATVASEITICPA